MTECSPKVFQLLFRHGLIPIEIPYAPSLRLPPFLRGRRSTRILLSKHRVWQPPPLQPRLWRTAPLFRRKWLLHHERLLVSKHCPFLLKQRLCLFSNLKHPWLLGTLFHKNLSNGALHSLLLPRRLNIWTAGDRSEELTPHRLWVRLETSGVVFNG